MPARAYGAQRALACTNTFHPTHMRRVDSYSEHAGPYCMPLPSIHCDAWR